MQEFLQELTSSGSNAKINSLISMYNYQLNMIRAVTGINEARDGSMPESNALVGVQKLAALNSNTATKHVMTSGLHISKRLCEAISCRITDILMYSDFAEQFARMVGKNNMDVLKSMEFMHLHEFGIFVDLEPDEEEKAKLEQNVQMALQAKLIDLADAIDVREVKNLTLANQLLKINRKTEKRKSSIEQNKKKIFSFNLKQPKQSAQAASQGKIQQEQAKTQGEAQILQLKADLDMQKLQATQQMEAEMLKMKYQFEMELKQMESKKFK